MTYADRFGPWSALLFMPWGMVPTLVLSGAWPEIHCNQTRLLAKTLLRFGGLIEPIVEGCIISARK
jgi:hypothetical protein